MGPVLQGLGVLAMVIAVGFVLARLRVLPEKSEEVLAKLVFFVATPALLFHTLAHAPLATVFSAALPVTAITTGVGALAFVLMALLRRRRLSLSGAANRQLGENVIGALASCYVNAGNLGIPISTYLFSTAAYVAPVMMYQLIVLAPIAFAVLDMAATGKAPSLRRVLAQPVRNPIVLASLCGVLLAVSGWTLPEVVAAPITMIGNLAVPGALLAFGMSLYGAPLPGREPARRFELASITTIKLVLLPTVAYTLGRFVFDMDPAPLMAATLCAALPTAQNVFVYSVRYRVGVALARESVLATTLGCVPVLIVIVGLLHL